MRITRFLFSFVLAFLLLAMSPASDAQVRVAIAIAPPPMPIYEQPICQGDGYIWTPGYWTYDYDDGDYYWVPGTWVLAPEVGFLWTPGYWGWGVDGFIFYAGYWGPVVGFYGGINYGFGYFGHGYEGGRWDNGRFYYNTTVNRVNVEVVHNVYNTRVTETTVNRVSYNGGNGGITARPTPQEESALQQRHIAPVSAQIQHEQAARSDKQQRASVNHGAPPVAATPRPGAFKDNGVVRTREAGGPYNATARSENASPKAVVHPKDLPPMDRPVPPNTGNPKQDQKYQQEQEKLQTKQQTELQKLQQKQEQEHQQMAKQQADEAKKQQMEQRHQQQTQQLQQKHAQQTEQLHQRQQPPSPPPPHQGANRPPH
jgi:WXXGXW repeat (2 copies)